MEEITFHNIKYIHYLKLTPFELVSNNEPITIPARIVFRGLYLTNM